jgi:hypothetical protein
VHYSPQKSFNSNLEIIEEELNEVLERKESYKSEGQNMDQIPKENE